MALHGNDQPHFAHGDGCAPENPMLKDSNSLFHNVSLTSHMPTYPMNSYSHNAQLLLKNFPHCATRPEFCLPPTYGLAHDNQPDDTHLSGPDQPRDFGHRPGIRDMGQHNNSSENSIHDIYSERSQSSTGHVVRTRRRKAGGMEEARVCVVCGEPASGYNFDRLTCESCKAFFRRNALKPKEKIKACGRNGDCNIEGSQRKHCPSCRLEKCLAVGMKKELILPPEKLEQRAKPKRRKQNHNPDELVGGGGGAGGSGVPDGGALPPPGLLPFGGAAAGGAPGFVAATPHSQQSQHLHGCAGGPRMAPPPPHQFGAGVADEFMVGPQSLTNLINDMSAGGRGGGAGGGQFGPLGGLSDPQAAAAAAAMKFHLAMTSGNGGASTSNGHGNVGRPGEAFDPHRRHFMPTTVTTDSASAAAAAAAAFMPRGGVPTSIHQPQQPQPVPWQPALPPPSRLSTTLVENSKPLVESPYCTTSASSPNTPAGLLSGMLRPRQCRYRDYQSLCFHSTCRRALLRQQRRLLAADGSGGVVSAQTPATVVEQPDEQLWSRLRECVQRIREPFTSEEPLDTRATETLEQEYNRMDTCIRRIIRVVKMLPYFNEIGKPIQLDLLRANIYGMIVLYSSFFFESNIRKLRYPVKQADGSLTTVTVSMLEDLEPAPADQLDPNQPSAIDKAVASPVAATTTPAALLAAKQQAAAANLREDFELYKANTLAAFNHLEELTGQDDILRMTLLAIKLFSDDALTDDKQPAVMPPKRVYLVFLWTYIRWRAGPKRLRQATELFARLHLAFIDLRSLEVRMTEFAKLVSLDGLSPLMREICSHSTTASTTAAISGGGV